MTIFPPKQNVPSVLSNRTSLRCPRMSWGTLNTLNFCGALNRLNSCGAFEELNFCGALKKMNFCCALNKLKIWIVLITFFSHVVNILFSRFRFLRSQDREMNKDNYPLLTFPEIYLLEGGYKAFYYSHLVNILIIYSEWFLNPGLLG